MSSNRGSYKSLHPDIRQYRDIAPESLSDEVLLKLVHDNGKNPVAVKEALEALWNEEPAGQWVTNEKKTKKVTPPPQTSNERGGRGRGRSAPPGRGDSGRGGRGSGGRSSSVSTNTQNGRPRVSSSKTENSNTSTPNQFSKIEETEKTETVIETSTSSPSTTTTSSTPTPTVTTTASAVVATKTTKLSTAPVWGSGPSLAQKIREQELAASAPPPPPPVVVVEEEVRVESVEEVQTNSVAPVSSSSAGHSRRSPRTEGGRGRGRKRGGRDSQPPRSTHITSETNNNNSDNNNENNNNNNNINDNIDENNINNNNNHVEQVVEENVEESVEQVVESIQNVHIEKIAEEIPEPVQNNNILQNDITNNNNNTHNVQVIPDILMSPPRSNNPVTVSDTLVGSPVLKMGRWGASLESTDVSSFQFGSFGNLGHDNSSSVNDGDESPHKIASGLISSLTESQNTWGQQSQLDQNSLTQSDHETENVASLSVWGNTQSQNDNPDDSYNYDQQVSSSANDNSVHSAPPGLGLSLGGLDASSVVNQSGSNKSGNNRNSNRSAPGQTRKNDIDNNISRQPQSYYQGPPGMQPGGFGIPYGYGFDMNTLQPPTVGYGATTQTNSTSPGAPGTNSNGQAVNQNTTNNNNQNNSNQNTANNYNNANAAATGNNAPKYPGPPGMPAQMGAYPPYYANPYYSQAYFYGGAQPQNFYGRGGQAMYPPRPYGADPYAPPMPGYDMYGQPGQFGDAVYGQIPMQPMHPQQNATSNDNRQNNGKGGNKNVGPNTQQSAGAVGGVTGASTNVGTTQPDANQAIHSGYGMGAYNAYGRADQGAAWPPYQAWNQMMFPPGVGLGGGYSPMGGIPPQPTNNRHDQTSRGGGGSGSYNSYGRGAGSSTNGQNDSTGIGGGTASW